MKEKISRSTDFREEFNVTTRSSTRGKFYQDNPENTSNIAMELYKSNQNTTIENMRSEVVLEIEEYTYILKGKIDFDIS